MTLGFTRDPLWRAVFWRALLGALIVALCAGFGWVWAAVAGLLCSAVLAANVAARTHPLRHEVAELSAASAPSVDSRRRMPPARELALLLRVAREKLARERRKAELERDDILSILRASTEGILVLGRHMRVEMINDAARQILEPPVDPLGRSLSELVSDREILEFAESLREGSDPEPRRIRLPHSGGTRWIHLTAAQVRAQGARNRAVLVLHDLTDLQHLEQVRTDFVSNVTHEMRSPLASILGDAETLSAVQDSLPAEMQEDVQRILQNSRRLDDIIADLIELARLEHATRAEREPCDVAELIAEIAARHAEPAKEREVSLEIHTGTLPPALHVDAGLLRQAVGNLVDNAVKYTSVGGRVSIQTELITDASTPADTVLEIAVSDTGPGIPSKLQDRIFERFYRVDPARSRSLGGTGLGLAIVKHAVTMHGGAVLLESEQGQGACFRVRIPLSG